MSHDMALERLDILEASIGCRHYVGDLATECRGLEILVTKTAKTLTWLTINLTEDCELTPQPAWRNNPSPTILNILARLPSLEVCDIHLPSSM